MTNDLLNWLQVAPGSGDDFVPETPILMDTIRVPHAQDEQAYRIWLTQPEYYKSEQVQLHVRRHRWIDHEQDMLRPEGPDMDLLNNGYPFVISYVPGNWTQEPLPTLVAMRVMQILQTHCPALWTFLEQHEYTHLICAKGLHELDGEW